MLFLNKQNAFTLVEMAIVITIIGLLIGGTLQGVQMMKNAKVSATAMQIKSYEAAVNTFQKTYKGLPGDLIDAHKKIPNCKPSGSFAGCELVDSGGMSTVYTCIGNPAVCDACPSGGVFPCTAIIDFCTPYSTCPTSIPVPSQSSIYMAQSVYTPATGMRGDGIIGPSSWDMVSFRGEPVSAIDASTTVNAETLLFWYELQQADLISGITNAGLSGASKASFGKTHPAAKMGGGFWVAYSDGINGGGNGVSTDNAYTGRAAKAGNYSLIGNVLVLVKIPTGGISKQIFTEGSSLVEYYSLSTAPNKNLLTPKIAADIDRKIDDGAPATGSVQAFGVRSTCYSSKSNPATAPFFYDEVTSNKDCGIYALIKQ